MMDSVKDGVSLRNQPDHTIDPRAIPLWRLVGGIYAFFYILFWVGLALFFDKVIGILWIHALWAGAVLVPLMVFQIVLIPSLRWKHWRYEVREHDVDLMYGIWFRKRIVIPMVRIQHVDTVQGPLMRNFELSSVTFSTAAGSHEIPAISNEISDMLRDRIAELARVSDEDV